MKTLLVILALLISGSTYAWGAPTKNVGCYGIGKVQNLAEITALINGGSGTTKTTTTTTTHSNFKS
jgi:hypothetical protein